MKKKFLSLIFPIVTVILEILPYGAVCNFANPEGEPWRKTYSYFSLTPFGYANFSPFITAIISCVVLLLLIFFCVTGKNRLADTAEYILCADIVFSLCPLFFGINYFSVVGALISASLIAEMIVLRRLKIG